jgi:hypothetical protein
MVTQIKDWKEGRKEGGQKWRKEYTIGETKQIISH